MLNLIEFGTFVFLGVLAAINLRVLFWALGSLPGSVTLVLIIIPALFFTPDWNPEWYDIVAHERWGGLYTAIPMAYLGFSLGVGLGVATLWADEEG